MKTYIMKIKMISLVLFLFCSALNLRAQPKQWTLEECIQYATENNIELKQREQQQELSEIAVNTSENAWLPNLNASIGQDFSFGRVQTEDGTLTSRNGANTSFGAQATMPLFEGFRKYNDIAARRLDLQAAIASLEKAKEDLAINVTSYYLQVLYNKEILKIAEQQVELTTEQVLRTEALVKAGRVPLSQVYDIKAQLANDEVTLTEAKNNVELAMLDLIQSLELELAVKDFDIRTPETENAIEKYIGSIQAPDDVYQTALNIKPQIKEQEYLLERQWKALKIAQANYYPTLSLSLSYGTGYYYYFSGLPTGVKNQAFNDQFTDNAREMIGFSLSIPIFNRFQIRNNVKSARINIISQELAMESTKKVLYKEIQQSYYNAVAAQEKYLASEKSVTATREAFVYMEERYAAGKSTVFEFNESKTKYAQSLSERVQAKYNYIFRTKILDFYNGIPITL